MTEVGLFATEMTGGAVPTLYAPQTAAYAALVVVHDGEMVEAVALIAPAAPSLLPTKSKMKGAEMADAVPEVPRAHTTSSFAVAVVSDGPVGFVVAVAVLVAEVSSAPMFAVSKIATLTKFESDADTTTEENPAPMLMPLNW